MLNCGRSNQIFFFQLLHYVSSGSVHFTELLNVGLPWAVNVLRFWVHLCNPFLDIHDHSEFELLHCLALEVLAQDQVVNLVPEGILSVPNVLLLNDVQVERADLLHAEEGMAVEPTSDQSHFAVFVGHASLFEHEVAHPLLTRFREGCPLEDRQIDQVD